MVSQEWCGGRHVSVQVVGGTQVATYDQLKQFYASFGVASGLLNQFCSSMVRRSARNAGESACVAARPCAVSPPPCGVHRRSLMPLDFGM